MIFPGSGTPLGERVRTIWLSSPREFKNFTRIVDHNNARISAKIGLGIAESEWLRCRVIKNTSLELS